MKSKIVTVLALIAIVFGTAFGSGIQLQVYEASNNYWLAVAPSNDGGATTKIELQGASSSTWNAMNDNAAWGYFTYQSNSGLSFPVSFRFTDASGNQVVASNVMSSVSAGSTIDTGVSFSDAGSSDTSVPPTEVPSTPSCGGGHTTSRPTGSATHAPTSTPTGSATGAPTTKPTGSATHAPTSTPTSAPTTKPSTGSATGASTHAPTTKPTGSATHAPTSAPTSAPTTKPSTGASSGGSSTHAPTSTPTSKPTSAPTSKPTTKPSTGSATAAPSTSGSSSGSSTSLCGVTANSQEPVQLLIPLYVDPGTAWDEVITAAEGGVKIVAIINPDSGPDASGPDSSYVTYMQKFASAGVTMVGYVHTSYGDRAISDVTTDIDTYASKYTGLSGIFIDEASASSSEISYYQQVYSAITSNSGYTNVILNPGTQPDQGYQAVSTNIVVFEDTAANWKSNFASWVTCAPSAAEKSGYKYKFSAIAYAASSTSTMSSTLSSMSSAGMGMVYVTDGAAGGSTYNSLASYFTTEVSDLEALN